MNGMNPWCALAASLISITVLATGCSDDSADGPAGQAGQAGQTGKAGASAGSGASGASGQAGKGPTGGNAGMAAGGKPSAGNAGSVSDAGSPAAGDGGSAGESSAGPYRAVIGELCPVETTIGVVELWNSPLSVQAFLYDGPDPWITEAEFSTPTCDFHRYTPGNCSACGSGEVCSRQDRCVPERRTLKNVTLRVSTGAEQRTYSADPNLGGIYSELDIGDSSSSYAMLLSWGETQITLDAMPVASGALEDVAIETESDQFNQPGALDATWLPPGDAAFVRSRIPINHHAGGPTFTECRALSSAGAFHAVAEMIDPLAVQTGLEFQGLDHVFIAAARTPHGCVEFRFGARIFVFPN